MRRSVIERYSAVIKRCSVWLNDGFGASLIDPSSRTLSALAAGVYVVEITDAYGCFYIETFLVEEGYPLSEQVNFTIQDVSCYGFSDGVVVVDGINGGETITWSNGLSGSVLTQIPAGTYDYVIVSPEGCSATGSVTVTEPEALAFDLEIEEPSCEGDDGECHRGLRGLCHACSWTQFGEFCIADHSKC